MQGLIGKKQNQTQAFLQDGTRIPLTVISAMGNVVTQVKTLDKDGYTGIQLGFDIKKKANKAIVGHSKKAGLEKGARFFKEIRDAEGLEIGAKVNPSDVFKPGDIVDVTGVSKGKGFAGVVKRHHFKGGPRTHGQSDRERAPGSIGQTTTPGHVYRGKRMAGRMGHENVTVKNLEVVEITNDGAILVNGLVPGSVNSIVVIKKVGENKKFVPLYKESSSTPASEGQVEEKAQEPVLQEESQEVKTAQEEVKTVEETVQAPGEEIKTSDESVETPSEEKTIEEKAAEDKKEEVAENAG